MKSDIVNPHLIRLSSDIGEIEIVHWFPLAGYAQQRPTTERGVLYLAPGRLICREGTRAFDMLFDGQTFLPWNPNKPRPRSTSGVIQLQPS